MYSGSSFLNDVSHAAFIPMNSLPVVDLFVIALYLLAMLGIGVYFSRKNTNTDQFTKASGHIPGWALGISLYATFLTCKYGDRRGHACDIFIRNGVNAIETAVLQARRLLSPAIPGWAVWRVGIAGRVNR